MPRTLILGGTSEAATLARALAQQGADAVFSYAGRTKTPVEQPLPTRVGGFGGVAGLIRYLKDEKIENVVDATHPFAAQMSHNAVEACSAAGMPYCAFERPAWQAGPGDIWQHVPDIAGAAAALPESAARVFLAIGKQNLAAFAARPQHHYLVRLVDPPGGALPLENAEVVIARGPFDAADDLALMRTHLIQLIVAKNAGGSGAAAKLEAARQLGVPVIMIDRPAVPARTVFAQVEDVLAWLGHSARLGV